MKVRVLKRFIDKNTKTLHKQGETLIIKKERYEEMNSTALGVFVEEIKKEEPPNELNQKAVQEHELNQEDDEEGGSDE